MNDYFLDLKHLQSESDVEQKVIYPLLINQEPSGLGYEKTQIQTKVSLQRINIDKGNKSILYYPDFLININGIPLLVVEAKRPEEDLYEAFRQASLYAAEINRKFDKNINPCQFIIACDGTKLLAGYWDSSSPFHDIKTEDWIYSNGKFNAFCAKFAYSSLKIVAEDFKRSIRKNIAYKKPLHLLGGKFIQNLLINNEFGENISINYRHLFNPNIEEERIAIVKNAYVKVSKHDSHVAPIDRLIRKKILPSTFYSQEIHDNTVPSELLNKIKDANSYNNQVLLLIGSVGSGKSTFTTYLKEVALDSDVIEKLNWITLDLNNAPVSSLEIYPWIKNRIIEYLKWSIKGIDFDSIGFIQTLYRDHIETLKKGVLQLLNPESDKYKELLVQKILELQTNIDITLSSYIETLVHDRGKNLIIVLDNCDKRNLEEQLLMFEVANWIKETIKAIVILPLRDTTFDHYRHQKPLDTVIKDLTFRITPPSLEKVLYARLKYTSRLSQKNLLKFYHLPNGIKVAYAEEDEIFYLKSILGSLFQNNFFKRLISGLAGSDIRIGLEIFLDFCKSGHISEGDIFKIKQSKGQSLLPNHIISKVFLRGNRKYYSDESSIIKNVFYSDPSDEMPDPFVRVTILKWLFDRFKVKGPSGIIGFHKVELLISSLNALGHDTERVESEIKTMIQHSLIISESQDKTKLKLDELISINTPGIVHLELLSNIDYLSTCAEDIWYNNAETATKISKNMSGEGNFAHLSLQNVLENSTLCLEYLENYYNQYYFHLSAHLVPDLILQPLDFIEMKARLLELEGKTKSSKFRQFSVGEIYDAKIVSIKEYGLFVEIDNSEQTGLIHSSLIQERDFEHKYRLNEKIKVEIMNYNELHKKYDLKISR